MDCSLPGSSVHGVSQARMLEGLPCPYPGDLSNPGIETVSLLSPTLAGVFFTTSATWEARPPGKPHYLMLLLLSRFSRVRLCMTP